MVRLLFGFIATVLAAQAQGSVVSGIVIDEITGLHIQDAYIGIGLVTELNPGASTKTDVDGMFRFVNVRPGRYWIDCSAPGYVKIAGYRMEGPQIDVPTSGDAPLVSVRLTPAASIEGSLTTESGAPIINARVEADASDFHTTSGRAGQFRLDGLPPGEYRLRVWIDDATRRQQIQVDPSSQTRSGLPQMARLEPSVHLDKGLRLTAVPFRVTTELLHSASGTVADARTGASLEYGEIELRSRGLVPPIEYRQRQQLSNGSFRFDLLTDGSYEMLILRQPGIMQPALNYALEIRNADLTDLRIVLPSGGRVNGKITGPRDPRITDLFLYSAESQTSASTRILADGSFSIGGLAPGKWNIGFMGSPGGEPTTIASVWQSGKHLGYALTVVEGDNLPVEIVVARRYWVIGNVIDRTGKPVENAIVVFQNADVLHSIEAGPDGHYRLGIIGGDFIVTAWRKLPTPAIAKSCPTAKAVVINGDVAGLDVPLCP